MISLPRALRSPASTLSPVDRDGLASLCRARRMIKRVLAAAPTSSNFLVALPTHLAIGSGQEWTMISWDQIEKGSWNADTSTISFELAPTPEVTRLRHKHQLNDPGDFPRVFRDRVNATIAFQRYLPVDDRRAGITISARRDLATGTLGWRVTCSKGVRLSDPGVSELAEAATNRFRAEYDD